MTWAPQAEAGEETRPEALAGKRMKMQVGQGDGRGSTSAERTRPSVPLRRLSCKTPLRAASSPRGRPGLPVGARTWVSAETCSDLGPGALCLPPGMAPAPARSSAFTSLPSAPAHVGDFLPEGGQSASNNPLHPLCLNLDSDDLGRKEP